MGEQTSPSPSSWGRCLLHRELPAAPAALQDCSQRDPMPGFALATPAPHCELTLEHTSAAETSHSTSGSGISLSSGPGDRVPGCSQAPALLSLWCPGCPADPHAGSPVPPDLFVHIVVVGQASHLVQCLLLHGSINSRLGWGKERRCQGASQAPMLCPPRLGFSWPYLPSPPALPCRRPPQPGSWPCRCRRRCRAQRHPAPPASTRCPHTQSSGGCSPPAAPHPGGGSIISRVTSSTSSHNPFPMDGARGVLCITWGKHNPRAPAH